jgi:pyridoxine 4-dehydrogenase
VVSSQPSATVRTLTIAGSRIPRIGLGTNRLTSTPANYAFVREAVEAGVRHIDTAHVYQGGDSERAIGEALSAAPADLVVATKGGYSGSGSPEALRAQIDQSLASLRTGVIDLYYLHRVDPQTPIETSLHAIAAHREAGRIKEIGISSVSVAQIEAARKVVPIAAVQNHYSLAERSSEDVLSYCEENGIVFVPYFPLRGDRPGALLEIARNRNASPEQIALAWLLRRSSVMLPIPGTLSIEHLRENLSALDLELTDDELDAL